MSLSDSSIRWVSSTAYSQWSLSGVGPYIRPPLLHCASENVRLKSREEKLLENVRRTQREKRKDRWWRELRDRPATLRIHVALSRQTQLRKCLKRFSGNVNRCSKNPLRYLIFVGYSILFTLEIAKVGWWVWWLYTAVYNWAPLVETMMELLHRVLW